MNKNLHVLIVDDDRDSNQDICQLFKICGLCDLVKVALNGGHALLFLDQYFTDLKYNKLLILLDLDMPIMNGIEFLEQFAKLKNPYKQHIFIVVMVNEMTRKIEIERAKRSGAVHFAPKPSSAKQLKALVEGLFSPTSS